jgi:hypothetical protein
MAAPGTFGNVRARPAGFLNPFSSFREGAAGSFLLVWRPAFRTRGSGPQRYLGRAAGAAFALAGVLLATLVCSFPPRMRKTVELPITSASSLLDQKAGCGYSTAS